MARGKYPDNTPLDEWYSTWLFMEVASIVDQSTPGLRGKYMGMTGEQRRKHELPTTPAEARDFIRQHRPTAGLQ